MACFGIIVMYNLYMLVFRVFILVLPYVAIFA